MIAVKIGDGMGNQLFNYACGYAQARRDGDSLVLDISECDNSTLRDFELDKFHLKYDKKESFPNRNLGQKIYKNLRRALKYHVIKEREVYHNRDHRYDVNDIDPRVYKKKGLRNKYLYGYWQHLAYFEDYLDEITAMMTPAYEQSETVKKLQEEFKKTPTCAVHVRGGDIMGPPEPILNMPWNAWNRKSREYAILCLPMIWSVQKKRLPLCWKARKKTQWDRQKTGWNLSQRWENFRMWMNFS